MKAEEGSDRLHVRQEGKVGAMKRERGKKEKCFLEPPPPSRVMRLELVKLVCKGPALVVCQAVSDGIQNPEMFLLELLETRVQLLVPRVEYEYLEAERRAGDQKVGQRDGAGDNHGVSRRSMVRGGTV